MSKHYNITIGRNELLALIRYKMQRFMVNQVAEAAAGNQIEDSNDAETIARLATSKLKYTNAAAEDKADLDLFLSLAQLSEAELNSQQALALSTLKKDIEYLIRAGQAGITLGEKS